MKPEKSFILINLKAELKCRLTLKEKKDVLMTKPYFILKQIRLSCNHFYKNVRSKDFNFSQIYRSVGWFLYDRNLRHERVKSVFIIHSPHVRKMHRALESKWFCSKGKVFVCCSTSYSTKCILLQLLHLKDKIFCNPSIITF